MKPNAVIEKDTGKFLSWGFCEFKIDPTKEIMLKDVPLPDGPDGPLTDRSTGTEVHKWDGSKWIIVDKDLSVVQAAWLKVLGAEITKFIEARYSVPVQSSLNLLMTEANSKGWAARTTEVQKGITWLTQCLDEYYDKKAEVLAATTVAEVEAIALDTATLDAADPKVDLQTIRGLTS